MLRLSTVLIELGLGAVLLEQGGIQHQSLGIACCEDSAHWLEEEFRLLCYIPQCYCLRRLYIRICSVLRSVLVAISMYACMYFTRFPDVQRLHIGCRRKTDHYCIVQQSLGGDVRRLRIGWSRNSVSLGNFSMRKPQLAPCHRCHHRHLQHHRHQYYM